MTALIYLLGMVLFFLGVVISIALHEVGHMVPAKKFGVKVHPVLRRLRPDALVHEARRHRVRRQDVPARRVHPDDRDAAAGEARRRRQGRRASRGGVLGKLIADARAVEYEHVTADGRPTACSTRRPGGRRSS